ncbi:hypothetical protein [Caldilinea sp.]|uniref:hypothetical protein n=1 Tax=Caldilinea sp. TaxID=2293560 RepID=UPI002BFF2B04|nr:hypothetical protein [Anaerolineales bacterium]HQY92548.1 hypothetical protein [Caldilinea sp.]HRA64970.1 hypothetical protein [Caldilinea sp.]
MQDFLVALLLGLILGWVIEWLIDWRYWRRTVATLRQENAELRRQLQAQPSVEQSVEQHASSVTTATGPRRTTPKSNKGS